MNLRLDLDPGWMFTVPDVEIMDDVSRAKEVLSVRQGAAGRNDVPGRRLNRCWNVRPLGHVEQSQLLQPQRHAGLRTYPGNELP